jgi:hypothetical protein
MFKIFEKLLLNRIRNDTDILGTIPDYQFGFREHHSTIQQIHRIVNKIAASLEEKQYCTAAFLDIAQAFDKVWHTGLLYKLKNKLPIPYYLLLKSYISERYFQVKYLGLYLDQKLTWQKHIKTKRQHLNLKVQQMSGS